MTKVIDMQEIMKDPAKAGEFVKTLITLLAINSEKCDVLAKLGSTQLSLLKGLDERFNELDETIAELNRRLLLLEQ